MRITKMKHGITGIASSTAWQALENRNLEIFSMIDFCYAAIYLCCVTSVALLHKLQDSNEFIFKKYSTDNSKNLDL